MINNTWNDVDVLLHTGVWNEPKNLPGIEIPIDKATKFLEIEDKNLVEFKDTIAVIREDLYSFSENVTNAVGSELYSQFLMR